MPNFYLTLTLYFKDCLEARRLKCRILERAGLFLESLNILLDCVERFPQHLPLRFIS